MKAKVLSILLTVTMFLAATAFVLPAGAAGTAWDGVSVAAGFAGGDGTAENPYQISNGAELAYLASIVNAGNVLPHTTLQKHYVLTDDIDLGGKEWTSIGNLNDANRSFKGTFDGGGKTISGFLQAQNKAWGTGLFGMLDSATVKDLTLTGSITGAPNAGSFSGFLSTAMRGSSVAENCNLYITVSITHANNSNFGGVTGNLAAGGRIENCNVYGSIFLKITGDNKRNYTGGIVSRTEAASIINCSNYADITQEYTLNGTIGYVGGISSIGATGSGNTCYITGCANYGNIYVYSNNGSARIGGMIGNPGQGGTGGNYYITGCFNVGTLTTGATTAGTIGGIVGMNETSKTEIKNCFISGASFYGNAGTGSVADSLAKISLSTVAGAAVRIDNPTGLRFDTGISITTFDALSELEDVEITLGTVIAPTSYVSGAGAFTMAALDRYKTDEGFEWDAYTNVVFDTGEFKFLEETETSYVFSGAVAQIFETNYNLEYSAVGYVTITVGNASATFYSNYSEGDNSRTVAYVGHAAYGDRQTAQSDEYCYFIEADGNWSPYSAGALAKIKVFADAFAE